MRPLRVAVLGLIVVGIVLVRADTWPWPSVGGQARHSTGIVLLGPIDYDARIEPLPDPLRSAWSNAFTLQTGVLPRIYSADPYCHTQLAHPRHSRAAEQHRFPGWHARRTRR